jgi:hypothetical protein
MMKVDRSDRFYMRLKNYVKHTSAFELEYVHVALKIVASLRYVGKCNPICTIFSTSP